MIRNKQSNNGSVGRKKKAVKKSTPQRKRGRPNKYKPEYCQKLIDFFDVEPWEEREIPHYKGGEISWVDVKLLPVRMPTLRRFAKSMGVGISTVYDWCNPKHKSYHKDFSDAFTCAKEIRKEWLIDAGLAGITPPASFKFVAVNVTDMRDKQDHSIGGAIGTRELSEEEMAKLIQEKVVPFEDAIAK